MKQSAGNIAEKLVSGMHDALLDVHSSSLVRDMKDFKREIMQTHFQTHCKPVNNWMSSLRNQRQAALLFQESSPTYPRG